MTRAIDCEIAKKRLQAWIDESEAQGFEEAARNFRDCISLLDAVPTLTPPNEWVSRLRELDELYTKLHAVTGFTVEQLLEMFAAGYTLEKHDYSKSFEEMASLLEYEKEHANAYYEECGQWEAENTQLKEKLEALHDTGD